MGAARPPLDRGHPRCRARCPRLRRGRPRLRRGWPRLRRGRPRLRRSALRPRRSASIFTKSPFSAVPRGSRHSCARAARLPHRTGRGQGHAILLPDMGPAHRASTGGCIGIVHVRGRCPCRALRFDMPPSGTGAGHCVSVCHRPERRPGAAMSAPAPCSIPRDVTCPASRIIARANDSLVPGSSLCRVADAR